MKLPGWISLFLIGAGVCAAQGADDPFTAAERGHWAFRPVERPVVPAVGGARVRTPIDAFVLSRLVERGLTFSPDADRRDLIRRVTFDLIGLPPATEEIEAFVADERPDAYERLVDRLLDSPQYGECQARMWLDLVRFADTAGYNADPLRPLAHQYRDYVIRAFNEDRPFDRFVQEQLAGDELFPDDPEALLATGYLRMWPDESNASNILLARQDALNDLTANVGVAFLGLSLGCAQCHDHKFDPLPQRDFYALQAFFAGWTPVEKVPLGAPDELQDYRRRHREWLDRSEPARRELAALEAAVRVPLTAEKRMKFPAVVLEAIDTPPERRTALQRQIAFWSERQIDYKDADLEKRLTDQQKARRAELRAELDRLRRDAPRPPREIAALSIAELGDDVPPTSLLTSGSYDRPEEAVAPGFLSVLMPAGATDAPIARAATGSSGRRTALARWLTDPRHPLTARVMANRLWQERFGRGFVENANDLGVKTPRPELAELLDWLALEISDCGLRTADSQPGDGSSHPKSGSLKSLHRVIVTSTVYRQSTLRGAASESDPDNVLLSHFPRRRLSAERVRDALLATSGELNRAMYGPGVCPPLPAGYNGREAWPVSASHRDHARRSIYILAKRNLPYPLLNAFDFPDMHDSCACRAKTTTAPQALMLLNGELVRSTSERLALRLLADAGSGDRGALVERAWVETIGRPPTGDEARSAGAFFDRQARLTAAEWGVNRAGPAAPAVAETGREPDETALADLCHVLLNLNEFLYLE